MTAALISAAAAVVVALIEAIALGEWYLLIS